MTPKASPYNSRGFEQGENLRIKVNRLFDSERVALYFCWGTLSECILYA